MLRNVPPLDFDVFDWFGSSREIDPGSSLYLLPLSQRMPSELPALSTAGASQSQNMPIAIIPGQAVSIPKPLQQNALVPLLLLGLATMLLLKA